MRINSDYSSIYGVLPSDSISSVLPVNELKNGKENTPAIFNLSDNREPQTTGKNDDVFLEQKLRLLKKMGIIKCQTCESRKYVDRSDESNVSFKAPASIDPSVSFSAVVSHEMEHVANSKYEENTDDSKKILAQSVSIYTDICPECGKVYAAGGKTRTVMKTEITNGNSELIDKIYNNKNNNNYKYKINAYA